ncbi:MAG: hypothetical protein Q9165_003732 [Trypethelium subeluteriae]
MSRSKFERLQMLLGDDRLPPPVDRLSLNEAEQINPSFESSWAQYHGSGTLRGGGAEVEDLELASDDELLNPLDQSSGSAHSSKGKKKGKFTGRHQWIRHSTNTTKVSINPDNKTGEPRHFSLDPRRGQLSTPGEWFCPVLAISKFPYTFVNEGASQPIASAFFDAGKFWMREWDLHYVHPTRSLTQKPLLLIPLQQVQGLISAINNTFVNSKLEIPPEFVDIGLVIQFPEHPSLRPRFLGTSTSKAHFDFLESNVPAESMASDTGEPVSPADERSLEAFKHKIEAALKVNKARKNAAKAKKKDQRVKRQQDMVRMLKRAQRYLGIRPKSQRGSLSTEIFENWEDEREAFAKISDQAHVPPIDVEQAPPHPFDNTVVFICVDVEVWEKDHHSITEIGVSTLDTLDLIGVPPGRNGINWEPKIHKYHFRIKEYAHLVNSQYVEGCPDKFEFGQSEWISLADAPSILTSIFTPISTLPSDLRAAHYTPPKHAFTMASGARAPPPPTRNVVLVGHNVQADICYLRNLVKGFDPLFPGKEIGVVQNSPVIDTLDTDAMYRVLTRDINAKQLAVLLVDFDIAGWNLHNAGNDAAYTLHVMLAIALRAAEGRKPVEDSIGGGVQQMIGMPGEVKETVEGAGGESLEEKVKAATKEAEQRVREEDEGWESDDGDGGAPLPPSETAVQVKQKRGAGARMLSGGGVSLSKMYDVD